MAVTHWSLWVGTALLGVSFSLVPAVMWPLTAGSLKDAKDAGIANPAGYQPMMLYFFISSTLGFAFAMMLWRPAGRRYHKALAHAGQGVRAAA